MVAKRLVGPYGQRPTPTGRTRPSKSVASSHESRAGNTRDRKGCRERKGGMGDGKKRKQRKRLARRIPLSHCKHCNNCSNRSSSSSALAMTHAVSVTSTTGAFQLKELANKSKLLFRHQKDFVLVQLCKLQSFGEGSSQAQDLLLLEGLL